MFLGVGMVKGRIMSLPDGSKLRCEVFSRAVMAFLDLALVIDFPLSYASVESRAVG